MPAFKVIALLMMLAMPRLAAPASPAASAPTAAGTGQASPVSPPAAGAPAAAGADPATAASAPPAAIPVPEIVAQAERVTRLLRDFEVLAEPGPAIDAIRDGLAAVTARLDREFEFTLEALEQESARTVVDRLGQTWRTHHLDLAGNVEVITKRATQIEDALSQLAALRIRWTQARADAQASLAPEAVEQRVDTVLADIDSMHARLQEQRSATLVLQDRVALEVARCLDALARIDRFLAASLTRTFARDASPIWNPWQRGPPAEDLPTLREAFVANVEAFQRFAGDHAVRVVLHGLLFVGLALMARAAGRRARDEVAAGNAMLRGAALFDRPYSSATVAALAAIAWIYPDRPRLIGDVAIVLGLVPLLRIVLPLVGPSRAPALYGLAALIIVDRFRAELVVTPLGDQALLMLEMTVAIAGLAWYLRSFRRLRHAPGGEPLVGEGHVAVLRATVFLALTMCVASFAAAAYGAMRLARMLGSGLVSSVFVALAAYAAVQVLDGLLAFALRVSPLRDLGMVARNRDLLERRGRSLLRWVAAIAWAVATLRNVGLLDATVAFGQSVLSAELRQGAISISLGDVLVFVITVWLAFLASALIRFVMDEEVYPRLHLERGLPYVISSLLHYSILFLGFLLAVAALGADLNKVTILAGAFGVGLGLGLQGLVNNFVSGLIVLFERPIHVGDSIQMGDIAGKVKRIGIRSSTVLTPEGAEVILPNASLVAEKVTNWTHSDRQLRRLDVRVSVAYGSAPDTVLGLLRRVAMANRDVLAEPAPVALFLGFGSSALNFELRAWTNHFDRWVEIRSELGLALYAALCEAGMEVRG